MTEIPRDRTPLLSNTPPQRALRALLLVLAGALQTLSFSPWEFWLAGPVSIIAILLLCLSRPPGELFRSGWLVGLGLFGSGVSWVYVSIHDYGVPSAPVAGTMTLLFVMGLALIPGALFWCWGRLAGDDRWRRLCLFPALWLLGDWVRGWILTGFPWLYLGTAQVDGPLAGWAPLLGVHGLTLIIVASACALVAALERALAGQRVLSALVLGAALLPWLAGPLLGQIQWTQPGGEPIRYAVMQGNIPQQIKWDPDHLRAQLNTYMDMSEQDWDRDLLLWPETAIPMPHVQAREVLEHLDDRGRETGATLMTGIPWYGNTPGRADRGFHNSIMTLGADQGVYHKQKLVPFGEYVPLENWLKGTLDFFSLPLSSFRPGPRDQTPLGVAGALVHPFICYEIAYGDFVARNSAHTGFLLTISNDAWFGDSLGPKQHMQIARMRALETGRPLLRGTNNGITAQVDRKGQIVKQIPRFQQGVLRGEFQPAYGDTPYMATGSWPALITAIILIVFTRRPNKKKPWGPTRTHH
ncbi:MAG: apolipoprotein N-acyltransferase [Oleiphilaceae bacterium]|nr:apolipoprotein N-acyltransferase [Oleiphilaceae bacterium]